MSDSTFLHYVVAEYQILREMFYNPELAKAYQRDIFSHAPALAIYDSIRKLYDTTGAVTETDLLREANFLNEKVTYETVNQIVTFEKTTLTIDDLIKSARENAVLYQTKDKLAQLMTQILERKIDAPTLASELHRLQQMTSDLESGRVKFRTISDWLDLYRTDLEIRRIGNYQKFNDAFLDTNLTRKAEPGQIILIAGSTGNGKSAFSLNLINSMINCGMPVIYFSLEMDMISTMDRFMAIRTEISLNDWYSQGSAVDALQIKVNEQEQELKDRIFLFVDNPSISLADIESTIQKFKSRNNITRCIVFIDLVTQVKEFVQVDKSKNMATAIELACNRLNEIAKSENVCIVALAQVGRDADKVKLVTLADLEKLRPSLNDIKNSNALAERSRVVLSVFRPKYYSDRYLSHIEEAEFMEDFIEVQILKQSQGNISHPHQYLFDAPRMKIMPIIEVDSEGIKY